MQHDPDVCSGHSVTWVYLAVKAHNLICEITKNDEEFEWRAYAVINLVNQFQKTFEEVIGKPLNHAQEFFESEREEWLKSLGVPSIQKKE